MIFIVITFFLAGMYAFLMLNYRNGWKAIEMQNGSESETQSLSVSVIVAARNEEENIGSLLQSLKNQSYPASAFEIIVVNDHSEDGTETVVSDLMRVMPNLSLINLSEHVADRSLNAYKKFAIETGVKHAKNDLIITTDADCIAGKNWLLSFVKFWQKSAFDIAAAPVKFIQHQQVTYFEKLLEIFQTLDFMSLQGITAAGIQKDFHYMANGANLAYTKRIFNEVKGFSGVDKKASGDDMFLMEKIKFHAPQKIKYLKSKEAVISTYPEKALSSFIWQRVRWAGKSSSYNDPKIKQVLAFVYLVNVWMVIMFIMAFFGIQYLYTFVIAWTIKIIAELIFLIPVSNFFGQKRLLWWFVPAQPFHILYTVLAGLFGLTGQYKWKGRKVR